MSIAQPAERGSQSWMQRAVYYRHRGLETAISAAVGRPGFSVAWKSPLAPHFKEARDGRVFELLGCQPRGRSLNAFWPRRGPVWDGLAVVDDQYVLIEAKAHIPELISGGTRANGESLALIRKSLARTRKALAPRSKSDWASSPFFQYANRLASLQYLRDYNRLAAHLVFIYFIQDHVMAGPSSELEWRGALRLMEASLGISEHPLSPYVHKIFVDTRDLDVPVI